MLMDAFMLVQIVAFSSIVPLLARLPIRRLQRLVETHDKTPNPILSSAGEARIIRITETVCRLGRRLIRRRCMIRGLTLYFFLRRAGVDVSLVFGAGEVRENFEGHCWLERDGEPYLEVTDPRLYFTRMYAFPGAVQHHSKDALDLV